MNKISIILLVITLFGCKKVEKKQFSYWKINGQEYSSNNVEANSGKAIAIISSHDSDYRFNLTFYNLSFYPTDRYFFLERENASQNPSIATLSFFHNNKYYGIDNDTTRLTSSSINGKASYHLPKVWYSHYENGLKDSILIEATINEP